MKSKKENNKLKNNNIKVIVISLLVTLLILTIILTGSYTFFKRNLVENTPLALEKTIEDFQYERWNDIRAEVFGEGGTFTEKWVNYDIADLNVIPGNQYFNWKDTTSLDITPWNGETNIDGKEIDWKHFGSTTDDVTGIKTEEVTYDAEYHDEAEKKDKSVSNKIKYYVIDIEIPEELRWVLDTISKDKESNYSYKINILKDLDLNGDDGKIWSSIEMNINGTLCIEGNGHTIYNFKNSNVESIKAEKDNRGFFSTVNNSFTMKNLTFESSMVIAQFDMTAVVVGNLEEKVREIEAPEGQEGKYIEPITTGVFFENVKVKGAFVQSWRYYGEGTKNVGVLIGRSGTMPARYTGVMNQEEGLYAKSIFLKNCSTENAFVCGANHIGGFTGCQYNTSEDYRVKYDVSFPEKPEAFYDTHVYPQMIENCYSVDSEIFSIGDDSGAFISCGGKAIVRNCFTNNTIYANAKTGVFIGREVNKYNGTWAEALGFYDDNGQKTISSYYENCYTAGIIEGQTSIGGFIGLVDTRFNDGVPVFKNCYSTSMAGMEYSGENVGGFVGLDAGSKIREECTIHANGQDVKSAGSIFINCYAAGEVGDITTNTDNNESNRTKIGGFIGNYQYKTTFDGTSDCSPKCVNCYYDKQTTGMRERAIGYLSGNYTGQYEGISGAYTQGSSLEGGTAGLTGKSGNIVTLNDDGGWTLKDGLYPQLKVFTNPTKFKNDAELVKCYSQASASTVFLDHWDYIMTNDNVPYNVQTDEDFTPKANASENNLVYDTIRDITMNFEFTSRENSDSDIKNIVWQVDNQMNKSRGFIENFTINYGQEDPTQSTSATNKVLSIFNPKKDISNLTPELKELMEELDEVKDIYKCYEFAPGKSWVEIEVRNEKGNIIGGRKLRLLPMAYVDAGNHTEITIGDKGENKITYISSDGKSFDYNGNLYKHGLDTVYTTTSIENLGNSSKYKTQEVSQSPDTQFAMWGRYPTEKNTGTSRDSFDSLYEQNMIGDATEGLTKVAVYKLNMEYAERTLSNEQIVQIPQIDYDNAKRVTDADLSNTKWTGNRRFTIDDAGWYELRYYWRLDDGRYLSDTKMVIISASSYTATIETEIQNQGTDLTPEIQPDILEEESNPNSLTFNGEGVTTTLKENEKNTIVKTKEIENFTGEEAIMGWKNDGNYKLVDIQINVSEDGTNWTPLKLELKDPDNPYDFTEAKYSYFYQGYDIIQNPNTKQYFAIEVDDPIEIETKVMPIANGDNPNYANYLYLLFSKNNIDEKALGTIKNNVRVTATFVPVDSHVTARKIVDKQDAYTGDDVTYTVFFTPDNFNDVWDLQASDVIPKNTEYVKDSIELGEYIENEKKFIKYQDNSNSSSSYNEDTNTLSWIYNEMNYGKVYYAKFKVKVTGVVNLEEEDFIKVDNIVNFTYRKSQHGKPVDGEPSKAATFIIIEEKRVYLTLTKTVTTPNAPNATFTINSLIKKDGTEIQNYRWYIDYELSEINSPNIEIMPDQVVMFVGTEDVNGANYTIKEDTNKMPNNFHLSSITGNGVGKFEKGKVKNIVVRNYYRVPDGEIEIPVEKIWEYEDEKQAEKIPESVTFMLESSEENAEPKTLELTRDNLKRGSENIWEGRFTGLKETDDEGNEIKYTVKEVLDEDGYYKQKGTAQIEEITGKVIFTNKFIEAKKEIDINVEKIWEYDNEEQASKIPESVTYTLKSSDKEFKERTLKLNRSNQQEDNEKIWQGVFENVPKYDNKGEKVQYTIEEECDSIFYKQKGDVVVDDNGKMTITNKFTAPEEKENVKVSKIWEDDGNKAGKRPNSVTLVLSGNGQEFEKELTEANKEVDYVANESQEKWSTEIEVPKYDENGNTINYSLTEKDLKNMFYTVENMSIDDEHKTITNKFAVPEETTAIKVTKVWDDNDDYNVQRPEEITIELLANGTANKTQDISEANQVDFNTWTYTFNDLQKYDDKGDLITYSVREKEKVKDDLKYYNINEEITGDAENGFIIKNTVSYSKVTVHHYILDTTKKVPSKNGGTVDDEIIEGRIGTHYETKKSEEIALNYEFVKTDKPANGDMTGEPIEITYYYRIKDPTIDAQIEKDGPEKIVELNEKITYKIRYTINLTDYIGDATITVVDTLPYLIDQDASKLDGGKYDPDTKTITWIQDIKNINTYDDENKIEFIKNIEIVYKNIPTTATSIVNKISGEIHLKTPDKVDKSETQMKTKTDLTVSIPVRKIWEDDNNAKGKRPNSIEVVLQKNGTDTDNIIELNDKNKWTNTFEELPKYDSSKREITYSVKEKAKNKDELKYYDAKVVAEKDIENGVTITNTLNYAKIIVHHYIVNTTDKVPSKDGKVVEDEIIEGRINDKYTTKASDNIAPNYKFYKSSGTTEGNMTSGETEIYYYYIVKNPEVITPTIVKDGLDEIIDKNTKITYTINYETTIIDYIGNGKVTIIDELPYEIDETKSDLANGVYDKTHKTITWTEEIKDINSYDKKNDVITITKKIGLVYKNIDITADKITNKVKGKLEIDEPNKSFEAENEFDTKVNIQGEVIVKYVEKSTGKELLKSVTKKGKIGKEFDVSKEKRDDIEGYVLIEEPKEKKGKYKEEKQEKIYYYKKLALVTVKYIDKKTGKEIESREEITGAVGDKYTTKAKDIPNYDLLETPKDKEGKLPSKPKEIIYYYIRKIQVDVRHVEKGTDKTIDEEIIKGHDGDSYTTKQKEMEYYKLVEKPKNEKGTMKVSVKKGEDGQEIIDDTIEVTYYYEKMIFNMELDKEIVEITLNGKTSQVNGDLAKVELYREGITKNTIKVVYNVTVRNTGEIAGKALLRENIPFGMNMPQEENSAWKVKGTSATLETEEIAPGKEKTYKVCFTWKADEANIKQIPNTVEIVKTENAAGFEEKNNNDNKASTDVIIAIGTGIHTIRETAIELGIISIILLGLISLLKWQRKENKK